MKRKQLKQVHIVQIISALAIILLINYLGSFVFHRFDLTQERRYSVAPESSEILKNLDDVVYIRVYLDGDLPIGFMRLKTSIRELLDEFNLISPANLQYDFIDPAADPDSRIRNNVFKQLYDSGLQPTNAQVRTEDGSLTQKILFPGAIISYRNIEVPVNLLKNNPGLSGEVNLHQSIQSLEYEFISMIRNLSSETIEKVAFLEGHGELDAYQVGDITKELANFYQVDRGAVQGRLGSLDHYSAVIIAKPLTVFSEQDKFVIDQYIMNGGKVIWLIDPVQVSMDSLYMGTTVAAYQSLNLEDQLFRYGLRLNPNLVMDVQCHVIPVNKGLVGGQANFQFSPWFYFPVISPGNNHPITRALNMILIEFGSVIDTVGENRGVKKTILLSTSPYSKQVAVPLQISLRETENRPLESEFNKANLPLAILLEGEFESVFTNRSVPGILSGAPVVVREKSEPTKMIVIADGDLIQNEVRMTPEGPMISPLGFDKYTSQTFGNRDFILNAVNYLTDEKGLMRLRGREFKLRLLDRQKIQQDALKWKLINTILPVLIIILFGIGVSINRKKKYSKPSY